MDSFFALVKDFFKSGFVSDWHKLMILLKINMQSTNGLFSHLSFGSFMHSAATIAHLLFVWHHSRCWGNSNEWHTETNSCPYRVHILVRDLDNKQDEWTSVLCKERVHRTWTPSSRCLRGFPLCVGRRRVLDKSSLYISNSSFSF